MVDDLSIVNQTIERIVDKENVPSESILDFTPPIEFKENLRKLLSYLLEKDFEKLLNFMYRVDINESKFKKALESDDITGSIADLVINRQLLKIYYRKKYS